MEKPLAERVYLYLLSSYNKGVHSVTFADIQEAFFTQRTSDLHRALNKLCENGVVFARIPPKGKVRYYLRG